MNESPWKADAAGADPDKIEHCLRVLPVRRGANPELALLELEMLRGGERIGSAHIEMSLEQLDKLLVEMLAIRRWMRLGRAGDQQRRERMRGFMRARRGKQ